MGNPIFLGKPFLVWKAYTTAQPRGFRFGFFAKLPRMTNPPGRDYKLRNRVAFCIVNFTWMDIWHSPFVFANVWVKRKNPQQPATLARIFRPSGKDQLPSKRFDHTLWATRVFRNNHGRSNILRKRRFWLILLCSAFLCLSILRSIEVFLHISDDTCAPLLMHYFLTNAFD